MTAIDGVTAGAGAEPWSVRLRRAVSGAVDFPEATATFSRPFRRATVAYALGTFAVVAAVASGPTVWGQIGYLETWWVSLLLTGPALVLSAIAAVRARPNGEAGFWRWWTLANAALIVNGVGVRVVAEEDVLGLRALGPVAVGVSIAIFMHCNAALMRRRSGGRSVALDAVQTAIAIVVLVEALGLLVGDRMVASPVPWFTYPAAASLIGAAIGLIWVVVLFLRTPPHHRRLELIGIALGATAVVDGSAQLAQGLSGFTLPPLPLLAVQQLTMLALLLVPLHASRVRVPGLERLAPHQQLRGGRAPTVLTIVAIPVLAALALARRDQAPYALEGFAFTASELAVLLAVRALLALNETKRLYREVAVVSEERRRLLGALTRNLDGDRHRVAAQLHQQAIASYASFSSYLQSAARLSPNGIPLPETSEQVRVHLSRTAERWREFMLAVRPLASAPAEPEAVSGPAASLRVAIVAHVVTLTDDERAPTVTVDVDNRLHPDWATEALVLCIVQEAVAYLRHARLLSRLDVGVTAHAEGLEVRLAAEGIERRAEHPSVGGDGDGEEHDVSALASFVALGNGDLDVDRDAVGTVLVMRLRRFASAPDRTPRLRVVPPAD